MGFLYPVLFVIAGAAVGSFLNVCADRLPGGRPITGRSACESCSKTLGTLDLVPVFSFLWLRGRCRYCGAAIPLRLPVVEAVMAIVFGLIWLRSGTMAQVVILSIYASLLVLVAEIDMTHRLILNKITYPWAVLALALSPLLLEGGPFVVGDGGLLSLVAGALLSSATGGLLAFAVLGIIYAASSGGMGFGDVKLAGVIGLMVGLPMAPVALVIGMVSGGLVAAALLLLRIKGRKYPLPFGAFLAFGALATLFWGPRLWETYLGWLR